MSLPCLVHEDDDLLVINKPAGFNTHAPAPHAGQGLYEWLRDHEPRWASLAIIHRLDKDTSGLILFSKSDLANRSLTGQFTGRSVRKTYLFATDRSVAWRDRVVESHLARQGARRVSDTQRSDAKAARTRFRRLPDPEWLPGLVKKLPHDALHGPLTAWEARPMTGRTHQIRAQAAEQGLPIFGDSLYRGSRAPRLHLHAAALELRHPRTGQPVRFEAACPFRETAWTALRKALIDPEETDAFRWVHGASDGWRGWYVDQLNHCLLSQAESELNGPQRRLLEDLVRAPGARDGSAVYHKRLLRKVRESSAQEASPRHELGTEMKDPFLVRENGLQFEIRLEEGYSTGLFLDQRENRRRLLNGHVCPGFSLPRADGGRAALLNTFSYTCAFSVCAARHGYVTTSLDLSRKYLDWGRRNFVHNQLDPGEHDFIFGNAMEWMRRLARKGRRFDVVLLDPPTFSKSKTGGLFRAEKDYALLVSLAAELLVPDGVLFASCNAARLEPAAFLAMVRQGVEQTRRRIRQSHYVPQPPDFPVTRAEPAYLKTFWARIG